MSNSNNAKIAILDGIVARDTEGEFTQKDFEELGGLFMQLNRTDPVVHQMVANVYMRLREAHNTPLGTQSYCKAMKAALIQCGEWPSDSCTNPLAAGLQEYEEIIQAQDLMK